MLNPYVGFKMPNIFPIQSIHTSFIVYFVFVISFVKPYSDSKLPTE